LQLGFRSLSSVASTELVLWPPPDAPVSVATWLRELTSFTKCLVEPPPFPTDATRGHGEPVLLVPAFLSPDFSTAALRKFLCVQGFAPEPWGCGINFGPTSNALANLRARIRECAERHCRPVSVVGISLGGTLAREAAKGCGHCIERLITVASPVNLPVITPLAPIVRVASLFWDADMTIAAASVADPPPIPLTAVVSLSDGVVDWRACVPRSAPQTEVVTLHGDHMTLGSNPEVLRLVAARLAGNQNSVG
jgi:pimeloyl-ACP methyl ester carboxylesterase